MAEACATVGPLEHLTRSASDQVTDGRVLYLLRLAPG